MKENPTKFAICTHNDESDDLEPLKIYRTLPDESAAKEDYIRIIDESGEDYLYPANYFILISLPQTIEQTLLNISNNLIKHNQESCVLQ
jgi:hypothetical protein